jgi:hypothetical protein
LDFAQGRAAIISRLGGTRKGWSLLTRLRWTGPLRLRIDDVARSSICWLNP